MYRIIYKKYVTFLSKLTFIISYSIIKVLLKITGLKGEKGD